MGNGVMVYTSRLGITAVRVDGRRAWGGRVCVFDVTLGVLTQTQREALVNLVYRQPQAHSEGYTFYDGRVWAERDEVRALS